MYFKWLTKHGTAGYTKFPWSLPILQDDESYLPGEWTVPVEGEIIVCENGYHAAVLTSLFYWGCETDNVNLYELEYRKPQEVRADGWRTSRKAVGRQARLLREIPITSEQIDDFVFDVLDTIVERQRFPSKRAKDWCTRYTQALKEAYLERTTVGHIALNDLEVAWTPLHRRIQGGLSASALTMTRNAHTILFSADPQDKVGNLCFWATRKTRVMGNDPSTTLARMFLKHLGIEIDPE